MSDNNSLTQKEEIFPHANVPGARLLEEVLAGWAEKGLVPLEVTAKDFEQTIRIKHDAATGQFTWRVDGLDGVQALGLLADVLYDMFVFYLQTPGRPRLNSGEARVILAIKDNDIKMAYEPKEDPTVIKGLLMAALWQMIGTTRDPAGSLNGLFEFKV